MTQTVFITGASGGIGQATVAAFAEAGWQVIAGVRDTQTTVFEALANVRLLQIDVADVDSIARATKTLATELKVDGLQLLLNNAGFIVKGPVELVPPKDLQEQFAVNTIAPILLTQQLLPLLRQGKGRIINISATSARTAIPFFGAISASKAALESFSDALRMELRPWHIPVIIIEPGATNTTIFQKADKALARTSGATEAKLYAKQLTAFSKALAKQPLNDPGRVARIILRAATATNPRTRYLVGKGTMAPNILRHFPDAIRDFMLVWALGLH